MSTLFSDNSLTAGKINSPRDIAVSAVASVGTTVLTDVVINHGFDVVKNFMSAKEGGIPGLSPLDEIRSRVGDVFANFGNQQEKSLSDSRGL